MSSHPELTVSWSRLRAYAECAQKAHLQSTGKRNKAEDIRIFAPGSICDSAMRDWLLNPGGPSMRDLIPEVMQRFEAETKSAEQGVIRWRTTRDRDDVLLWCQRLSDELQPILESMVVPYEREVGKRFRTPIRIPGLSGESETIYLIGEMDLYVDNAEIWDLKSTENESYWRKTVGQITFYDVAKHAMTGSYSRASGLIQPMCKLKVRPVVVEDADRRMLVANIVKYAHSVWNKDFRPKADSAGCSYCPVRHACERYATKPGTKKISLLGG